MSKQTFKEDLETIKQRVKFEEMQSNNCSLIIILAKVVQSLAEEVETIKARLEKGGIL